MNSKNHLPLKGVYSWEKWTKPNPSIGTENPPADISSVDTPVHTWFSKFQNLGNFTHATEPPVKIWSRLEHFVML